MNDNEAIEMMRRCVHELKGLRAENAGLRPQAEAYNVIRDIIDLIPKRSQGYGEDLVWRLEKKIKELEAKSESAE